MARLNNAAADAKLSTFAGPLGWEDDANLTEAQRYAYRDAAFYPDRTLGEWRARLDAQLTDVPGYGKMAIWRDASVAMQNWAQAVQAAPATAPPADIYALASDDALSFIGW